MISKRTRRSARPQENLRQFALNNSKGVDIHKPPTSTDTVEDTENLVVALDGSMSLRKPLECVLTSIYPPEYTQHYLYDGKHKLVYGASVPYEGFPNTTGEIYIVDENEKKCPILIRSRTLDGKLKDLNSGTGFSSLIVFDSTVEVLNLNTTTVLGNVNVDTALLANDQNEGPCIDVNLYGGFSNAPAYVPRYIRIYYDSSAVIYADSNPGGWVLEIIHPEPNTMSEAEGTLPFNPNLNLDSPTSVRDVYGATVPSIKGIVALADSKVVGSRILGNPNSDDRTETFAIPNTSYYRNISVDANNGTYENSESNGLYTCTLSETYAIFDNVSAEEVTKISLQRNELATPVEGDDDAGTPMAWLLSGTVTIKITASDDASIQVATDGLQISAGLRDALVSSPVTVYGELQSIEGYSGPTFNQYVLSKGQSATVTVPVNVPIRYSKDTGIAVKDAFSARMRVQFTKYTTKTEELSKTPVYALCESLKKQRIRIATAVPKTCTAVPVYLKAVCQIPKSNNSYYATWLRSKDGAVWERVPGYIGPYDIAVRELKDTYTPSSDVEKRTLTDDLYTYRYYTPMYGESQSDIICDDSNNDASRAYCTRVDVLKLDLNDTSWNEYVYRFKIIAVEEILAGDADNVRNASSPEKIYRAKATVDVQEFSMVVKSEFEFFDLEFDNTVYGKKLYYKKSIYSYGREKFFNNIFVSDIDSFVTPLYNVIDLGTYAADTVTHLLPWRDYLISTTRNAMYLHAREDTGYLTKTISTTVGVPDSDSRCCKAMLNGIILKSGSKVYQVYPNIYSGVDSILNITELSKPIEDVLSAYAPLDDYPAFAFSTDREYVLMLPTAYGVHTCETQCLRYDYSSKLWTVCTYPITAVDVAVNTVNNVRIFGKCTDGNGKRTLSAEFIFDSDTVYDTYGDSMPNVTWNVSDTGRPSINHAKLAVRPIHFKWDTGQKTDNIAITKQFVESKLVFATSDDAERLPMELTIHVDGDPHVTTLDLSSDAPFWKTEESIGVTNTTFRLNANEDSKILRQLIVRYSGKGKSVRHILKGSTTSNFRLYETYVRYKTLNVKR